MIKQLLLLCFFFIIQYSSAQYSFGLYTEAGKHAASSGWYSDLSALTDLRFGKWGFSSAAGIAFQNDSEKLLRGWLNTVQRNVVFGETLLSVNTFHLWKPFSSILYEQNFGVFLSDDTKPLSWKLGLFTKQYRFNRDYRQLYPDAPHAIIERLNIMYQLAYTLPISECWSIKANVTNTDAFVYELDTNPMVIASVLHQRSDHLQWFADLGYRQSGLFNIRVNYYGYFLRGGVRWVI